MESRGARGSLVSHFNHILRSLALINSLNWHIRTTALTVAVMAMAMYFALVKQIDFDYLYTGMP